MEESRNLLHSPSQSDDNGQLIVVPFFSDLKQDEVKRNLKLKMKA